jgi:hypothetical protein
MKSNNNERLNKMKKMLPLFLKNNINVEPYIQIVQIPEFDIFTQDSVFSIFSLDLYSIKLLTNPYNYS